MVTYAFQEMKKRKSSYLLNILLIGLVVALIVTLSSLAIAYKDAARLPFERIHSSIIIQKNGNVPENTTGPVLSCSLAPIPSHFLSNIRAIDGVNDLSSGLSIWEFDSDHFKRVLGVHWNDSLGTRITAKLVDGRAPATPQEILVEKTYANQYDVHTGQSIVVGNETFTITGIVATAGNDVVSSDVYMDLAPAQRLAYHSPNLQATERFNEDDVNIIFVDADQTKIQTITSQLKTLLADQATDGGKTPTGQTIGTFTISTPASFESQINSLFLLSDRLIMILLAVVVIGATLVIIKNTSHTVLERQKEFGIMKAVGFRSKDIKREVIAETSIQLVLGYIVGLIVAGIAIFALAQTAIAISIPWDLNPYPHFLTTDPGLTNTVQTYPLPIQPQYISVLVALGVVAIIGLLTALFVVRHLNALKPVEVLKYE